jgi:hypothetical protein
MLPSNKAIIAGESATRRSGTSSLLPISAPRGRCTKFPLAMVPRCGGKRCCIQFPYLQSLIRTNSEAMGGTTAVSATVLLCRSFYSEWLRNSNTLPIFDVIRTAPSFAMAGFVRAVDARAQRGSCWMAGQKTRGDVHDAGDCRPKEPSLMGTLSGVRVSPKTSVSDFVDGRCRADDQFS